MCYSRVAALRMTDEHVRMFKLLADYDDQRLAMDLQ